MFAPEGRGDEPLSSSEIALVAFVLEHMHAISDALLSSLLSEYPRLQEQYGYTEDEAEQYMPDVHSVDDFRGLIGLHSVNVHQVARGVFLTPVSSSAVHGTKSTVLVFL